MELKQIKELMATMEKGTIKKLKIKSKDYELELEKEDKNSPAPQIIHAAAPLHPEIHHKFPSHHEGHSFHAPKGHLQEEHSKSTDKKQEGGKYITSPMVGTLYAAASPEDAPFVKVGDKVDENTVVCIIEAMKVMNEVKAGVSGTIAEVLVGNGNPVEFGTKIFRVT